jgi:hypothetical protein
MIHVDLASVLTDVDRSLAAATGTKRVHYSASKEGPFHCLGCAWYDARKPEGGEDPAHMAALPHGRCFHPEVLQDAELPWADAARTGKVVEAGGCCEYFRRSAAALDLSELLVKAERTDWMEIPIVIEARAGEDRYGRPLPADYGYIERVMGMDRMELDCFVREYSTGNAYVIRMATEKANEQEDKCFLGFQSEADARHAFASYYGASKLLRCTPMPLDDLKAWLKLQGAAVEMSGDSGKGQWVTIDGVHVYIQGGVITKGPKSMVGKNVGGESAEANEGAEDAWDNDRTATSISKQSENLVKKGLASGPNGKHAENLLGRLGQTKAEDLTLYRGLSNYDLKNLGTLRKGSEFSVTGLKSFTRASEVAEGYAAGQVRTVLQLSGKSRTLNLPMASVAGGERLTNGKFKVTRISEHTGHSDVVDREITVRTVTVKQLGIYGKRS